MPESKPVAIKMAPDYAKIKDDMRRSAQAESEAKFKGTMFEGASAPGASPAEAAARASTKFAAGPVVVGPPGAVAMSPLTMGGPMAGMLSPNPAVRGATATSEKAMQVADLLGLSDEYKSMLSDLESRGFLSINPEYAKQAGVSTRYTRYQSEK